MSTLDSLPADQRAVLQLVLGRGRTYDDIGVMLSIDRAAVRERALGALDALGPDSDLDPVRRGLITDYLLGQLPPGVAVEVRNRLAEHPDERAWARVVAGELVPLGAQRLPEIPAAAAARPPAAVPPAPAEAPESSTGDEPEPFAGGVPPRPDRLAPTRSAAGENGSGGARSSRLGGALLLGGGLLVVIVIVLVIVLSSGGSSHHSTTTANTASTTAAASNTATTSAATTSSGTTSARPIAQVNLTSPSGGKRPGGAAVVVRQGGQTGLVIRAVGLPANTKHDAYAVWLSNPSGSPSQILGFVNPAVGSNGILQTAGVLPAGVARYKELVVTLETQAKPKTPGRIVLQGALSISG